MDVQDHDDETTANRIYEAASEVEFGAAVLRRRM